MNERQIKLCSLLLEIDQFRPIDQLAHTLECSERTIRNDVASINQTLEKQAFLSRIIGKRGSGIRFELSDDERSKIDYLVAKDGSHAELKIERFCRGVLLLGTQPQGYPLDTLASLLYTNTKRLREELTFWRDILNAYGVDISTQKKLHLTGEEWAIRFSVVLGIYTIAPTPLQYCLEAEFFSEERAFLTSSVWRIEKLLGFRLSPNARRQLFAYLALSIQRIFKGFAIRSFNLPDPLTAPSLIAEKEHIERHFHISLPSEEAGFLSASLPCYARQWDTQLVANYKCVPEAQKLALHLTNALATTFGVSILPELKKPLEILMDVSLSHRIFPHMPLPNPHEKLMKFDYMDKYLMIQQVFLDNEHLSKARLAGSDCARFTMMFIDYLEEVAPPWRFRAALVINTGIEQVIFSTHRIKKMIPFIDVVAIFGEDDGHKLDEQQRRGQLCANFDFLISFEPLDIALPCVNVSPCLTTQDLERITSTALSVEKTHSPLGSNLKVVRYTIKSSPTIQHLIETIYAHLMEQQCFRGSLNDFFILFEQHKTIVDSTLVLSLHSICVTQSIALFYTLSNQSHASNAAAAEITSSPLAVLLVAAQDKNLLPIMVERFKRLLHPAPEKEILPEANL